MNHKSLFLLTITVLALTSAWGQCTDSSKAAKINSLFLNNGGSGPYVKTGQMLYAGILVEDKEGKVKVANVNESCTARFENGDIILTINQAAVNSKKEWDKTLKQFKEGDKVQIGVERGTKRIMVDVSLEKIDVYKSII